MGQYSHDTVVRVVLGSVEESDRRVLERVLGGMSGVTAFEISDEGVLVVSLGSTEQHESLARAFSLAGIVPLSAEELGLGWEGDRNAC